MPASLLFTVTVLLAGCTSSGARRLPPPDAGPGTVDGGDVDAGDPMTCDNGMRDGDETALDCGGSCDPCEPGAGCVSPTDCTSGVCVGMFCLRPACDDGTQNGDETGVDCGGVLCDGCAGGEACTVDGDCLSGVCEPATMTCAATSCGDGVLNGDETDVDCGGTCPGCMGGLTCTVDEDCASLICMAGSCTVPSCMDRVQNGDETDMDCGGSCPGCRDGAMCTADGDCTGMRCEMGACISCMDAARNGDETDVDCGGTLCGGCADGLMCMAGTDCTSMTCDMGTCVSCMDATRNGAETDVDCGGGTCPGCGGGAMCTVGTDCATGMCMGGTCTSPPVAMVMFPSTTSVVCSAGSCGSLGAGGGGSYFRTGDYVEQIFTGTGLAFLTGADLRFDMDDLTAGCAVGQPLSWNVLINGTVVGNYGYTGGARMMRFTTTRNLTFPRVNGTGAGGDAYTLRFQATTTVCPGGASWNWFPGGTATLRR